MQGHPDSRMCDKIVPLLTECRLFCELILQSDALCVVMTYLVLGPFTHVRYGSPSDDDAFARGHEIPETWFASRTRGHR